MSNLSPLQQYILTWLINRVHLAEQQDRQQLERGIYWWPEWTPKAANQIEDRRLGNVWRASLCRSLARLEQRGLIQRIRGRKQARTARVRRTDEGRKVARQLSVKSHSWISRETASYSYLRAIIGSTFVARRAGR